MGKAFASLTPREVRICTQIRRVLSTKDIARAENISMGTVSRHRENIRGKLGLKRQHPGRSASAKEKFHTK